jgi:hypothetical protein
MNQVSAVHAALDGCRWSAAQFGSCTAPDNSIIFSSPQDTLEEAATSLHTREEREATQHCAVLRELVL